MAGTPEAMAGTPASPFWMQPDYSSWSLEELSSVQNANLSDNVTGYAVGADMTVDFASPVDPFSIFSENMPVVEDISSQALSWPQDNTPAALDLGKDTYVNVPSMSSANIDGDANLASFGQEGCLPAPCLQNNTPPSVFAAAPRNSASFEQEGFNQDFAGVANEGKAEKLCVKRQGRKRRTVYTTNGDIMSQLKKMQRQMGDQLNEVKTENEKLKKEVEERQNTLINRLIKMYSKQNHELKWCQKLLVKMFYKMKQVAVCNNKAHCCSAE